MVQIQTPAESPILVQILFPKSDDLTFDWDHYKTTHLPLGYDVYEKYGIRNVKVSETIGDSEYAVCSQMEFPSIAQWEAAQKDPRVKEVHEDGAKVTNGKPVIIISKILATIGA